jgi:hypothetical protein
MSLIKKTARTPKQIIELCQTESSFMILFNVENRESIMDKAKTKKLKDQGWIVGSTQDFLGLRFLFRV